MWTRLNKTLVGLLVVQALLVVFVLTRGGDEKIVEKPLLPGFDAAAVTRVQLFGNGDAQPKVDLVKRGSDWAIASSFDYPADAQKVTDMLAPIAKMQAGEPIATSESRHKQLRVAPDELERKAVITVGGKDTIVWIGAAAGTRRTAVRLDSDERVYAIAGISAFSMGLAGRDWVKANYFDVPKDEVTKVAITKGTSVVELEKIPPPADLGSGTAVPPPTNDWKVTIDGAPIQLATGETLDKFAVETIVSDAATISANPADPKRDAATPTATIAITHKGKTDTLDVVVDGSQYWVKQRGEQRATLVDKTRLDPVIEVSHDKLVQKPAPKDGEGSGSGSGSGAKSPTAPKTPPKPPTPPPPPPTP